MRETQRHRPGRNADVVPSAIPSAIPAAISTASPWIALVATLASLAFLVPQPARADDAKEEAEQLRARVVELRRELVMRDLEIQRLAEELAELREQVAGGTVRGRSDAPSRPEAPTMIEEDIDLSGLGGVEEIEVEEPAVEPTPEIATGPAAEASPATAPSVAGASTGGEELYDQGYSLFHQQKYPESERAFRLFLSRFPTSDLADNALFWIGESRWARGDFAAALESYTTTVEQYPDGNKVPDALLKAGRCLENLGQTARAARTYEEVKLRFAGSAAAITAEERLAGLR